MKFRYTLILMMFTGLYACGDPESESADMVTAARQYEQQDQFRAAALELKNALKVKPDNAEARYMLGRLNMIVGEYRAAEKEFRRAMQSGWNTAEARIGIAAALMMAREFDRVIENGADPGEGATDRQRADLLALVGLAQLGSGNVGQAEQALQRSRSLDADAMHGFRLEGNLLLDKGDAAAAHAAFQRGLSAHPGTPGLLVLSAEAAMRAGMLQEAASDYDAIIADEPELLVTAFSRIARVGRARLYIKEQQFEQAKQTIEPLFRRFGEDPVTNYIAAMLSISEGDNAQAEKYLLKVLKLAPDHTGTQLLYGAVSFSQQNYEQAAYYLSRYVDKAPENAAARKLLGRTYIMLGQDENAKQVLAEVSNTRDSELLAMVGFSAMRSGDLDAGIAGLQQALELSPEDAGIRSDLAKAYITAGQVDRAIDELNKLVAMEGESKRADSLLIIAHLRQGENEKAISVALSMLAKDPGNPAVLTIAGNVFAATGDESEAMEYLRKALAIDDKYIPAAMALARKHEEIDDIATAVELYESISNEGKASVAPLMALARIAEEDGDDERMLVMLRRARKQAPDDTTPVLLLAQHHLENGDFNKAGKLIARAEDLLPNNTVVLSLRARNLMASRQYNEALGPLNELVTRLPSSVYARSMLAETYWRLGQLEDARRQLELVLENESYYLPALMLMANVEQSMGDTQAAQRHADRIKKISPDQPRGYEIAADLYYLQQSYKESIENYRMAMNLGAGAGVALKMSKVYATDGKYREAIRLLEDWVQREPDRVELRSALGQYYMDSNDYSSAIRQFEKVLEQRPDDLVAINNLAWMYASHDTEKAESYASRAIELAPDSASVLDTYGWVLIKSGDAVEARRILEKAYKMLPGTPEVAYHYAVALIESGQSLEGKRLLSETLRQHASFDGRADAERLLGR